MRFFVNRRPEAKLRRTADIVFPRRRVAVFIDGCFWHGCPIHHTVAKTNERFWADKVASNMQRDAETTLLLEELGWTVVRIWEHEPVIGAADAIEALVRQGAERP